MLQTVTKNYVEIAEKVVQTYLKTAPEAIRKSEFAEVLLSNADRIQGQLVLVGYELCGGTNYKMIQQAALAIELFHAYTLCMERGTAAEQALRVVHEAEIILANLDADPEYRLKVVSITNRTMMLATLARNPEASEKDVTYWKSTELALNPLHVGQVLAGAECDATNAVTPRVLQFGEDMLAGKVVDFEVLCEELRLLV